VNLSSAGRRAARLAAGAALLATALLAGGCATVPAPASGTAPGTAAAAPVPGDPWEAFNRKVFSFNETVDNALVKPVATAYTKVVPSLVRRGVSNFFGNIDDAWSAVNHLLQGKVHHGLDMGMRVLTNSFIGLGGVLDPATEMGLVKRSEDFGQTLGRWGVGSGPYLMLPLLGPSTLRDSVGRVADRQVSASQFVSQEAVGYGLTTLEIVNLRANLLSATRLLDDVALDRYSFLRQAYLAARLNAVYDGAPPLPPMEDIDPGDDAPAPAAPPGGPAKGKP
jgi:phospholipid-binding lipoprotein MlaA